MNTWTDESQGFRQTIREFLRQALPAELRDKVLAHEALEKADFLRWQQILADKGWLGWSWPREFGGPGWSAEQIYIFEEECWLAGAPEASPVGLKLLAPVLMKYGSAAQQQRYLPRILRNEEWWGQGYSEPNAGSDLASLKTSARVEGDHLVLNGQKTWMTYGHYADMLFCLVRTDPAAKKQAGISFVLVDAKAPGVEIRPIILLDGTHEVNEVFFDNVKVPLDNLVGELNQGWLYAKALLGHERFGAGKLGRSKRELRLLKRLAAERQGDGLCLLEDPRFAEKIAQVEVDILAIEHLTLRLIQTAAGGGRVGAEASILKLRGTEIAQQLSALLLDALGPDLQGARAASDLPDSEALVRQYLNWRKVTIYGGSNEVQRNIIAQSFLDL
ncbi:MAG: acyl-CoA dehydrogenase family protein [Variovorax sp.]|nr:acyl-CoA dehydrogenase family protein [Variovorax sp.]